MSSPEILSAGLRHQWAWEREAAEKAWEKSMDWDCIFMGRLMGYQ